MSVREYVFVLTDANVRTGKRGGTGGETVGEVLGGYDRDVINGKLLLLFAEDNKVALLNMFQSVNRGKGHTRFDYILNKKADCRQVCCVNILLPPLESAESDHDKCASQAGLPQTGEVGRALRRLGRLLTYRSYF